MKPKNSPSLVQCLFLLCLSCLAFENQAHGIEEPQLKRVFEYRQTYAILGKPDTKVQFSFKGKPFKSIDLFFAYTQLMMWDFFKRSSPFRDINYNPEVFYRWTFNEATSHCIDIGAYEHESNGRDGDASRSWERTYLRYHSGFKFGDDHLIDWSFKAWFPYMLDETNLDLLRYRGIFEVQGSLSNVATSVFESDDLTLRFYGGGRYYINPIFGGQELTLRGRIRARNFLPYIVLQLFHGYGENLLNYKDNRFGLRAGFGF